MQTLRKRKNRVKERKAEGGFKLQKIAPSEPRPPVDIGRPLLSKQSSEITYFEHQRKSTRAQDQAKIINDINSRNVYTNTDETQQAPGLHPNKHLLPRPRNAADEFLINGATGNNRMMGMDVGSARNADIRGDQVQSRAVIPKITGISSCKDIDRQRSRNSMDTQGLPALIVAAEMHENMSGSQAWNEKDTCIPRGRRDGSELEPRAATAWIGSITPTLLNKRRVSVDKDDVQTNNMGNKIQIKRRSVGNDFDLTAMNFVKLRTFLTGEQAATQGKAEVALPQELLHFVTTDNIYLPSKTLGGGGLKAIHYAARTGHVQTTVLLHNREFDGETADDGRTPLMLAASSFQCYRKRKYRVFPKLLQLLGKSIVKRDKRGKTLVHYAAEGPHLDYGSAGSKNSMSEPKKHAKFIKSFSAIEPRFAAAGYVSNTSKTSPKILNESMEKTDVVNGKSISITVKSEDTLETSTQNAETAATEIATATTDTKNTTENTKTNLETEYRREMEAASLYYMKCIVCYLHSHSQLDLLQWHDYREKLPSETSMFNGLQSVSAILDKMYHKLQEKQDDVSAFNLGDSVDLNVNKVVLTDDLVEVDQHGNSSYIDDYYVGQEELQELISTISLGFFTDAGSDRQESKEPCTSNHNTIVRDSDNSIRSNGKSKSSIGSIGFKNIQPRGLVYGAQAQRLSKPPIQFSSATPNAVGRFHGLEPLSGGFLHMSSQAIKKKGTKARDHVFKDAVDVNVYSDSDSQTVELDSTDDDESVGVGVVGTPMTAKNPSDNSESCAYSAVADNVIAIDSGTRDNISDGNDSSPTKIIDKSITGGQNGLLSEISANVGGKNTGSTCSVGESTDSEDVFDNSGSNTLKNWHTIGRNPASQHRPPYATFHDTRYYRYANTSTSNHTFNTSKQSIIEDGLNSRLAKRQFDDPDRQIPNIISVSSSSPSPSPAISVPGNISQGRLKNNIFSPPRLGHFENISKQELYNDQQRYLSLNNKFVSSNTNNTTNRRYLHHFDHVHYGSANPWNKDDGASASSGFVNSRELSLGKLKKTYYKELQNAKLRFENSPRSDNMLATASVDKNNFDTHSSGGNGDDNGGGGESSCYNSKTSLAPTNRTSTQYQTESPNSKPQIEVEDEDEEIGYGRYNLVIDQAMQLISNMVNEKREAHKSEIKASRDKLVHLGNEVDMMKERLRKATLDSSIVESKIKQICDILGITGRGTNSSANNDASDKRGHRGAGRGNNEVLDKSGINSSREKMVDLKDQIIEKILSNLLDKIKSKTVG
ncbi:hypothetical protein AX774_g4427 [Zancudomyces culisetae]|nr:hypothetical protein AX774_g4427 [Zancudomyces culisetae]|eukprot:OMH82111.1 hypothetical protein AX774_g4427 [Zancudomyces culisetae]